MSVCNFANHHVNADEQNNPYPKTKGDWSKCFNQVIQYVQKGIDKKSLSKRRSGQQGNNPMQNNCVEQNNKIETQEQANNKHSC